MPSAGIAPSLAGAFLSGPNDKHSHSNNARCASHAAACFGIEQGGTSCDDKWLHF
jgi:hypothetical protein